MYIGALRCGPRPYTGGYDHLIEQATEAMKDAYAPYSGFLVGAALLCKSGRIYSAGNIENASSGADICAERAALARPSPLASANLRRLPLWEMLREPISPCGICRQSLIEFGEDIVVIMANVKGDALTAS